MRVKINVISDHIIRGELVAVVLGVTVLLAAGCSSTGTAVNARLIAPVSTNQHASGFEEDGWYQPPQSPSFKIVR